MAENSRRVAFLMTSEAWGGLEMYNLSAAKWMAQIGWQVFFLAPQGSPSLTNAVKTPGLICMSVRVHRKYADLKAAREIAELMEGLGCRRVVIMHNRDMDTLAWSRSLFSKQLRVTYVTLMQLGVAKKSFAHRYRQSQLNAWVDLLDGLKAQTLERTAMPPAKVHILPIGVETARFLTYKAKKTDLRQELGLPKEAFMAVTVGRLDAQKGQQTVIEALQYLRLKEPGLKPIHYIIAGHAGDDEGRAYQARLHTLVKEKGLEDVVHFCAFRPDPEAYIRAADVFVMASHSETIGLVTIESQLLGIPVIGTNTGGTPELLKNGELGYLFTPQDAASCAQALRQVIIQPEVARQKAAKAKAFASDWYDHLRFARGLAAVL